MSCKSRVFAVNIPGWNSGSAVSHRCSPLICEMGVKVLPPGPQAALQVNGESVCRTPGMIPNMEQALVSCVLGIECSDKSGTVNSLRVSCGG